MKFEHVTTYDAAPDQVFAMLIDPEFREAVAESQKAPSYSVDVETDDDRTTVTLVAAQVVRKIPDFAKKLVGEQIEVHQVETWTSPAGGDIDLTIPGKPGALHGTISLAAQGDTTVHTVKGNLKVSIPLVGGRLESLVADLLKLAMDAQAEVGHAWLAG